MSEPKRYIIVAGISGAGKSTLYRARPELFTHFKRLNADEILQKMVVDWHKNRDNFRGNARRNKTTPRGFKCWAEYSC